MLPPSGAYTGSYPGLIICFALLPLLATFQIEVAPKSETQNTISLPSADHEGAPWPPGGLPPFVICMGSALPFAATTQIVEGGCAGAACAPKAVIGSD